MYRLKNHLVITDHVPAPAQHTTTRQDKYYHHPFANEDAEGQKVSRVFKVPANEWQSQDSNPESLTPEATL